MIFARADFIELVAVEKTVVAGGARLRAQTTV
jgi:hypothetical protein